MTLVSTQARRNTLAAALLCIGAATALAQAPPKEQALVLAPDDASLTWAPCPEIFPKGCEVAVLYGDPAKGRSDIFLRSPAGYKFPPHTHTSPEHMILVTGELLVKYEGQEQQTLRAGSYAFGPPKRGHEAQCANSGRCTLFVAFESPIDALPFSGKLE